MSCGTGPNLQSCPADDLVPNWDRGKPAAFDLSITSTLHSSVLLEASMTAGSAALVAEKSITSMIGSARNWVGSASHLLSRLMGVGVLQQWWPFLSFQIAFPPG